MIGQNIPENNKLLILYYVAHATQQRKTHKTGDNNIMMIGCQKLKLKGRFNV